jgi:hypothetical protein
MVGRDNSLMILFEDGPRVHQTSSAYFPSVIKTSLQLNGITILGVRIFLLLPSRRRDFQVTKMQIMIDLRFFN